MKIEIFSPDSVSPVIESLSFPTIKSTWIILSLTPAFSDYSAWITNNTDLIIIATPQGKLPNLDFDKINSAETLKYELARIGITSANNMNFRQVADANLLRAAATAYSSLPPNSDFHPILSLHAPKTRFQSASASAFFSLPFINGNLLAAMDIRQPFPSISTLPVFSNFLADHATSRARLVAKELREPLSSGASQGAVLLKAMSGADCSAFQHGPEARMAWANQVRLLFEATQPFLNPDSLEGVWIKPAWQRCKTLPPDFGRVLSLLDSHARRDYVNMKRLGQDWLDAKPSADAAFLSNEFDAIALSGLLLTLVHEKHWVEVDPVLSKYKLPVPHDSEYRYQFDLIAGLAKSQKNPSSGK